MMLTLQAEKAPITIYPDGVARIGRTRINLEIVIAAFQHGDSPEQIVDNFDGLLLADVYAVIAYYLNHQAEVDAYMAEQERAADQVRDTIENNRPDMLTLQERLSQHKKQS